MSEDTSRPAWQTWTEEPWSASSNGTVHASGFYIGEVDEPSKADKNYASPLDVANALRIATCVNALAGVSGVAAVPEALSLVEELVDLVRELARSGASRSPALDTRIEAAMLRWEEVRQGLSAPPPA